MRNLLWSHYILWGRKAPMYFPFVLAGNRLSRCCMTLFLDHPQGSSSHDEEDAAVSKGTEQGEISRVQLQLFLCRCHSGSGPPSADLDPLLKRCLNFKLSANKLLLRIHERCSATSRGGLSRTRNTDFCTSRGGLPEWSEECTDISALLVVVWVERGMPADLSKFRQQSTIAGCSLVTPRLFRRGEGGGGFQIRERGPNPHRGQRIRSETNQPLLADAF